MMVHHIVIPLHKSGGKLRNNSELRFVLRSLERHFKGEFDITIIGERNPKWIQGVRHLDRNGGLKGALKTAAAEYPDGFFWWYDDVVLLKDATPDELKISFAKKGLKGGSTGWGSSVAKVARRLVAEGIQPWDYSHPHGPYWFDKSMVDEGFEDWPGMAGKFPWESWILSKRKWPRRRGPFKQYYGPFQNPPKEGCWYVNFNDRGFTRELRTWLDQRFAQPSQFERTRNPNAKVEVHTLAFGNPWWLHICQPTLVAWCERSGHRLTTWGTAGIDPGYPCPKFRVIDMLKNFLAGDSDWMIYVDADVYVSDEAPELPDDAFEGFLIRSATPGAEQTHLFPRWCSERFPDSKRILKGWTYRNTGVWICDRDSAEKLVSVITEPYFEGEQEQNALNWWLAKARAEAGLVVSNLDETWNRRPGETKKAHFYHWFGTNKQRAMDSMIKQGFWNKNDTPPWRRVLNTDRFPAPKDKTGEAMAEFHVDLVLLAAGLGRTGKIGVEIEPGNGASTRALLSALEDGKLSHLHIVGKVHTNALKELVLGSKFPERITLHSQDSWLCPISQADFVLINGDPGWHAINNALAALCWGSEIICIHNTRAFLTDKAGFGSTRAARMLKSAVGRKCFEDYEQRLGMRTQRGLAISTAEHIDLSVLHRFTEDFQTPQSVRNGPAARHLEDLLAELLGTVRDVEFYANQGNAGDALIAAATNQVFQKMGINAVADSETVLIGGGGNLTGYKSQAKLLASLPRGKRVIILPSTVTEHFDLLSEFTNLTLIAREERTFEEARSRGLNVILGHDAAFSFDYTPFSGTAGSGKLMALRTDRESTGLVEIPPENRDLSSEFGEGKWTLQSSLHTANVFVREISKYAEVETDRAHIAIAAAKLGKSVLMRPGSYHKNRSIYELSLQTNPNVYFSDEQ